MKKYIGAIGIGIIVVVCAVWIFLQDILSVQGSVAEVRVANEVVQTLPLDRDTTVTIQGKNDMTLVVIVSEGSVYVERSGCPDKICVNKGKISREYDTIVCLPAQTIIEIKTT